MLQTLHNLKRVDSYNQKAFSIENIVMNFGDKVKEVPDKNKEKEILKIVSKIINFNLS